MPLPMKTQYCHPHSILLSFSLAHRIDSVREQYKYQITSFSRPMQAKFAHKGFTNTVSGKINYSNAYKHKGLDLDDFDIEMLSPQFLQARTLKRPFKDLDIHLQTTNPNGTNFQAPHRDNVDILGPKIDDRTWNKFYPSPPSATPAASEYKYISAQSLNIKPAYNQNYVAPLPKPDMQLNLKDKNSIISALLRKGEDKMPINIRVNEPAPAKASQGMGPAESKLKSLFKKEVKFETGRKKEFRNSVEEQIEEFIDVDYENESFQKASGAYESGIKESIKESFGGSSAVIKESIRESMKDQIPEMMSFRSNAVQSGMDIQEEILESGKKDSIGQQIYDEDFEEQSISEQISKSKVSRFKKSKDQDNFELSVSASRGFRTKTNSVVKSIKKAEEISMENLKKASGQRIQQKFAKGDKLAEEILKEKAHFEKLQSQVSTILQKNDAGPTSKKNMDLCYRFKIEFNRLIASETFASKLRKLVSFLNIDNPKDMQINQLEEKLLRDVMGRIEGMRLGEVSQKDVNQLKREYDEKLNVMLKEQELSLRVEMDKKLFEKDLELKTMIAELEQRFQGRAFAGPGISSNVEGEKKFYGGKVEVDSDFSIDSQDVSWKIDLWEVLPDYEKRKLYEKQSSEVTKLLTEAILNDIKQESLDRSADISFEFPDEFNISSSFEKLPDTKKFSKPHHGDDTHMTYKSSLDELPAKKIDSKVSSFPPLPGQIPKPPPQEIRIEVPADKDEAASDKRDTTTVSNVIKILAKYKGLYLRKKNDAIRKLIKTIQTKSKDKDPLIGHLTDLRIVPAKEISENDLPYVQAYEEDIFMELLGIYNKHRDRKTSFVEEEMRKMYDRLVVTSQVRAAEASVKYPTCIAPEENYIEVRMGQEEREMKEAIVSQIVGILAAEFGREMPRRRK